MKITWHPGWNFERFHENIFQTDAESFSFLSWKTGKFFTKNIFLKPLSISKQKSFVYRPKFQWRFQSQLAKLQLSFAEIVRLKTENCRQSELSRDAQHLVLVCQNDLTNQHGWTTFMNFWQRIKSLRYFIKLGQWCEKKKLVKMLILVRLPLHHCYFFWSVLTPLFFIRLSRS